MIQLISGAESSTPTKVTWLPALLVTKADPSPFVGLRYAPAASRAGRGDDSQCLCPYEPFLVCSPRDKSILIALKWRVFQNKIRAAAGWATLTWMPPSELVTSIGFGSPTLMVHWFQETRSFVFGSNAASLATTESAARPSMADSPNYNAPNRRTSGETLIRRAWGI